MWYETWPAAHCTGRRKLDFSSVRKYLWRALLVTFLLFTAGCGSGDENTTPAATGTEAAVTLIPVGNGEYTVQGNNLDNLQGMQVDITHDPTVMSSPSVTKGEFISDAFMECNTIAPGIIKIAIIRMVPLSGSGRIATVTFANYSAVPPNAIALQYYLVGASAL